MHDQWCLRRIVHIPYRPTAHITNEEVRRRTGQPQSPQLSQIEQEAQLMLTTGSTRLAVSRGQQTWYHSTCYI